MIAVDTSALMAIVLDELAADACIAALEAEDDVLISAGILAEALIVSARRNVGHEVASLITGLASRSCRSRRPRRGGSHRLMNDGAEA